MSDIHTRGSPGPKQSITVPPDPRSHLGVFQSFGAVPHTYRLEVVTSSYGDRDVWGEFCEIRGRHEGWSDHTRDYTYGTTGRFWKDHMEDRGRHHAGPRPEDIESFLAAQKENVAEKTLYSKRFTPLYIFFDWLASHPDHRHSYNPVLMAAVEDGVAREMWEYRMRRNREKRENE